MDNLTLKQQYFFFILIIGLNTIHDMHCDHFAPNNSRKEPSYNELLAENTELKRKLIEFSNIAAALMSSHAKEAELRSNLMQQKIEEQELVKRNELKKIKADLIEMQKLEQESLDFYHKIDTLLNYQKSSKIIQINSLVDDISAIDNFDPTYRKMASPLFATLIKPYSPIIIQIIIFGLNTFYLNPAIETIYKLLQNKTLKQVTKTLETCKIIPTQLDEEIAQITPENPSPETLAHLNELKTLLPQFKAQNVHDLKKNMQQLILNNSNIIQNEQNAKRTIEQAELIAQAAKIEQTLRKENKIETADHLKSIIQEFESTLINNRITLLNNRIHEEEESDTR